jgi:hypothetical protein
MTTKLSTGTSGLILLDQLVDGGKNMVETRLEKLQSKRGKVVFEFEGHRFTLGHLKTIKREMNGEIPVQCYLNPRVRQAVENRISKGDI